MVTLHGVTVQLIQKAETGETDGFGHPVCSETTVRVANVLVAPVSGQEIPENLSLEGRKVVYQLGVPKGDNHNWEDTKVILPAPFSGTYRTVGMSAVGIEDMIPLSWNRKVLVERYE